MLIVGMGGLAISLVGCGEARHDIATEVDGDDEVDEPQPVGAAPGENACGGEEELQIDGESVEPGDACGECGEGLVVCNGGDEVVCVGDTERNACGGCEPLHAEIGDACGPCGEGEWDCDGDGGLYCFNTQETNACGGCEKLHESVGTSCGDEQQGTLGCLGPDEVRCVLPGENACGGDEPLDGQPGTGCGACDGGIVACESDNETTCVDEQRGVNDCGGCGRLPGMVGRRCGPCEGELACDGENDLRCVDSFGNACGGCDPLQTAPGETCEVEQGEGNWACESMESVYCAENGVNPCGGNTTLEGMPGQTCGECEDGIYVCSGPERVVCRGATERNACGGCGRLGAEPSDSCGSCSGGKYICATTEEVVCVDDATNSCGGCGDLVFEPGKRCGREGVWTCTGAEQVGCMDDEALHHSWSVSVPMWGVGGIVAEAVWAVGAHGAAFSADSADGNPELQQQFVGGDVGFFRDVWLNDGGEVWIADIQANPEGYDSYLWYFDGEDWHSEEFGNMLFELSGSDEGEVWAVGQTEEPGGSDQYIPVARRFEDEQWSDIDVSQLQQQGVDALRRISVGTDHLWVIAESGGEYQILQYDVGADDWQLPAHTTEDELQSIWHDETSGEVWAVGEDGLIIHYDGEDWQETSPPMPIGEPSNLRVVRGLGSDFVWAVGEEGVVFHYDGEQWSGGTTIHRYDITDIWLGDDVFWIVGRRENGDTTGNIERYGYEEFLQMP